MMKGACWALLGADVSIAHHALNFPYVFESTFVPQWLSLSFEPECIYMVSEIPCGRGHITFYMMYLVIVIFFIEPLMMPLAQTLRRTLAATPFVTYRLLIRYSLNVNFGATFILNPVAFLAATPNATMATVMVVNLLAAFQYSHRNMRHNRHCRFSPVLLLRFSSPLCSHS